MNFQQIKNLKGFMPDHEGMALFKWAKKFSTLGPILEIGTYFGKSTLNHSVCSLITDSVSGISIE